VVTRKEMFVHECPFAKRPQWNCLSMLQA
jgi:hypothetical protein